MNMLQHAGVYMPFVGAGLGPDMGPDMNLSKHEAPSWDPTSRMGLTELPDKSQVSHLSELLFFCYLRALLQTQ